MSITVSHVSALVAVFVAATAALGCIVALDWAWSRVSDRYEITLSVRRGLSVRRRWYGGAAHVVRRDDDGDNPDRFAVLDWWRDDSGPGRPPWLWVVLLDPKYLTYWDEDAEPFWAPAADFAPHEVRRFRPYLWRFGRVRLPWLTSWVPLRDPDGFQGGAR